VLIALALPIAPLYRSYERFMGGEGFIKFGQDSHLIWVTWESLEKGFCLILIAGILFLKIIKTLRWKQRSKHDWNWRLRVKSLSCGVNIDVVKILNAHIYVWWSLLWVRLVACIWRTRFPGCSLTLFGCLDFPLGLVVLVQDSSPGLALEKCQNRPFFLGLARSVRRLVH
jgi:hypothetical protein